MNTAAISLRLSTTVFDESSAIGQPEEHPALLVEDIRTEPPQVLRFEHEVARFQRALGTERDALRSAIVRKIMAADYPDEYVEVVIQTFVLSSRPGRLDDAVDILSETPRVLPQFVSELLSQPPDNERDEDYWYVLIRALGKSSLSSARMFIEMLWPKSPEAAVEALGDLGGPESLQRLRDIAGTDASEFIRQMAAEILEEYSQ